MVTIFGPESGTWRLEVEATPGAPPVQTGKLIVVSDNPRTDLFLDVDKQVITNLTDTVKLSLFPFYVTGLRNPTWNASLIRPDGTQLLIVPVPCLPNRKTTMRLSLVFQIVDSMKFAQR